MQGQEVDLTRSTRWAWKGFQERLTERLELVEPRHAVRLTVTTSDEPARRTPYVSVRREGEFFIAETPCNRRLEVGHRLDDRARRALRALGWGREKGDPAYRFQAELRYVDQVAHLCVATLRDVHGVLHPAFLEGDVEPLEDPLLPRASASGPEEPPVAAFPTDRPELEALVRATLTADLGHPVKVDQDGDFPFVAGTSVVFVRVLEQAPAIRLFAELVVEVADRGKAAAEVERLNQEHADVKFLLVDDRIQCERDLDAWPFAPQHLRSALTQMCDLSSRIDGEVARKVRGRCFLTPSVHAAPLPPNLELLLSGDVQLGRPRAELISRLCGNDLGQLRQWLRRAHEEQQAAACKLQEAVATGGSDEVRDRQRSFEASSVRCVRLARALRYALQRQPSP